MLIGFEKETHELTADEMELVPLLVGTLQYKVGVSAAVTNTMLRRFLSACTDGNGKSIKITEVRIRKLINHIRMKNLVPGLLASSKGYYVSNDPKEVKEYIHSLQGRENAIKGIRLQVQLHLNSIMAL